MTMWFLDRLRGKQWHGATPDQLQHWHNLVASDDDDHARTLIHDDRSRRFTADVIGIAIHHGQRAVQFSDGTSMSAADVHRALANREAVAVHNDLRREFMKAHRDDVRALRQRRETHELHDAGATASDDPKSFLHATRDAAEAAWDVLQRIGKGRDRGALAAARLLDLPDVPVGSVCSPLLIKVMVQHIRTSQGRAMHQRIGLVRAPPLLTGMMVDGDDSIAVLVADHLRIDGLLRTLRGIGGAATVALGATSSCSWPMMTALLQPPWLRAIGIEASPADWLWRVGTATSLLQARVAVAMTSCVGTRSDERTETAMAAMAAAMGEARVGDPPDLLREQSLLPALRTSEANPVGADETLVGRAHHACGGAAQWLAMRSELTEVPFLNPRLAELPWVTSDDADVQARAWNDVMAEVS
jgi:hypothetical protein